MNCVNSNKHRAASRQAIKASTESSPEFEISTGLVNDTVNSLHYRCHSQKTINSWDFQAQRDQNHPPLLTIQSRTTEPYSPYGRYKTKRFPQLTMAPLLFSSLNHAWMSTRSHFHSTTLLLVITRILNLICRFQTSRLNPTNPCHRSHITPRHLVRY